MLPTPLPYSCAILSLSFRGPFFFTFEKNPIRLQLPQDLCRVELHGVPSLPNVVLLVRHQQFWDPKGIEEGQLGDSGAPWVVMKAPVF